MSLVIQLIVGLLLIASICKYYNITRPIRRILDHVYVVVITILIINTPVVMIYGDSYTLSEYLVKNHPYHIVTFLWMTVFTYSLIRLTIDVIKIIYSGVSAHIKKA